MVGVCKVQVKANKVLAGLPIGGGLLWAPNNKGPVKPAAAWRFIEFLISPESQAYRNAETEIEEMLSGSQFPRRW